METREYNDPLAVRNRNGKVSIGGYAAVFYRADEPGTEYQLRGNVYERIMPGAFADSLRTRDVVALAQHNKTAPLGRSSAGTLRLGEDQRGLWYEVDLPDTSAGRDMAESVRRGDITGSSFGFGVAVDGSRTRSEGNRQIRELTGLVLIEVSPVTFPAYEGSSVGMRAADLSDDVMCKIAAEARYKRAKTILFDKYCGLNYE